MVARRGQGPGLAPALLTASASGEVAVEEYGYGLGPPTGILVLRYPPAAGVADFPESRNDHVHQLFWSPDGVLAVRRGATTRFLGPGEALWLRRGVLGEVTALGRQCVLRICLRQVPPALARRAASTYTVDPDLGAELVRIARPGVTEDDGLAVRADLLARLAHTAPRDEIAHRGGGAGPAHRVARTLLRDPADPTGLVAWAERLHVSAKTLQRHFERDYGMSFSAWRTRTRLRASLAMLDRCSVTEVAHRVGYASASAYVAAFAREYGEPPGRLHERTSGRRAG